MSDTAKAAHTPGPWKATLGISETDSMRCGVTAVRGKTEYLIATIENGAPGDFCETEEANARLIASAPDLLVTGKALDAAISDWREEGVPNLSLILDAWEAHRAAITKATGCW